MASTGATSSIFFFFFLICLGEYVLIQSFESIFVFLLQIQYLFPQGFQGIHATMGIIIGESSDVGQGGAQEMGD